MSKKIDVVILGSRFSDQATVILLKSSARQFFPDISLEDITVTFDETRPAELYTKIDLEVKVESIDKDSPKLESLLKFWRNFPSVNIAELL